MNLCFSNAYGLELTAKGRDAEFITSLTWSQTTFKPPLV
jgi:hypothetical protein